MSISTTSSRQSTGLSPNNFPKRLIGLVTVSCYCVGDSFSCREAGDNPHLRTEINKRFWQAYPTERGNSGRDLLDERRTVGQLLADARKRAEARRRAEAERQQRERAARERAQAEARARLTCSRAGSASCVAAMTGSRASFGASMMQGSDRAWTCR